MRYEIYVFNGFHAWLRAEAKDLDEARAKAREIERTSQEDFEGTALYDNLHCKWMDRHERETA